MKKINIFFILSVLVFSLGFISCNPDADIDDTPIPNSGLYFKMKMGDNYVWRGNNLPTMYVKTEAPGSINKFIDFIICTQSLNDSSVTKLDKYLMLHVQVNSSGNFSNYNVQYFENKSVDKYPITYTKFMYYKSGFLVLSKNAEGKISGKFQGKMIDIYDSDDLREVEIEFQDFPSSAAKK